MYQERGWCLAGASGYDLVSQAVKQGVTRRKTKCAKGWHCFTFALHFRGYKPSFLCNKLAFALHRLGKTALKGCLNGVKSPLQRHLTDVRQTRRNSPGRVGVTLGVTDGVTKQRSPTAVFTQCGDRFFYAVFQGWRDSCRDTWRDKMWSQNRRNHPLLAFF